MIVGYLYPGMPFKYEGRTFYRGEEIFHYNPWLKPLKFQRRVRVYEVKNRILSFDYLQLPYETEVESVCVLSPRS